MRISIDSANSQQILSFYIYLYAKITNSLDRVSFYSGGEKVAFSTIYIYKDKKNIY
jgi:DNA repair exonuclease SbcCD ATPase subunit